MAVFDNDGTLWCEKPMPIELGFILKRLAEMAEQDASLRDRQPWKAASDKDYDWLGDVITKHYHGDDSDVKVLMGGILQAFAGHDRRGLRSARRRASCSAQRTRRSAAASATAATCRWSSCCATWRPTASPTTSPRAATATSCGRSRGDLRHPARARHRQLQRAALREDGSGGTVVYLAEPDVFDDGPVKPVRIWSRIGRRPILAGGNSNGDIPMLQFAGRPDRPALRLLVLHDDPEREFDYVAGAEHSLERAEARGWTVVSVKNDWATVFG